LTDQFRRSLGLFRVAPSLVGWEKSCKEFIGCRFRQQSPRAFPAGGFVLVQVIA
jgi:hypothetical protein